MPSSTGSPRTAAPLCDMLESVWRRYRRPMITGETSGLGHGRASRLHDVMCESLASDPVALQDVIDAAHRLDMKPDKNWC